MMFSSNSNPVIFSVNKKISLILSFTIYRFNRTIYFTHTHRHQYKFLIFCTEFLFYTGRKIILAYHYQSLLIRPASHLRLCTPSTLFLSVPKSNQLFNISNLFIILCGHCLCILYWMPLSVCLLPWLVISKFTVWTSPHFLFLINMDHLKGNTHFASSHFSRQKSFVQ